MKVLEGHRGAPRALAVPRLRRTTTGARCARRRPPSRRRSTRSPNLTCDAGAILFGDAVTITADGPWQHLLHELTGRKWGNLDVENETGCGIVPVRVQRSSHRQCRPVGRGARIVAAHQGSVARVSDHGPSQRRLLLAVSGNHSAADGRRVIERSRSRSSIRRRKSESSWPSSTGNTRCLRSRSSRRRGRRARWVSAKRTPRSGGGCGRRHLS